MKNAFLLVLLSVILLFSCKKEETLILPDYSGKYSSTAILQGNGSNTYFIQYNAKILHSPNLNRLDISLYENYRNVLSNGAVGTTIFDTYTYLSPSMKIDNSIVVMDNLISAKNNKGANVGSAVFDGTITYTTTDMIYRGKINGKSLVLVMGKLATTTPVKTDDGW